ncbi:hypothetical protein K438DRAFT_1838772 [Mycena galopus ATCC 62051]|nr:hypothetical protein K438DRAFT_1838772 [Mycena galopus ATCC 62051]
MSSSSLIDWTTSQFTALYVAKQESSPADATSDLTLGLSAFAPDAEIHLNHTHVDQAKFREFVEGRRAAGSIVAGKLTLVRTHPFLIRAAPMKTSTVISFSAKIKQSGDKPQIVQLFQTSADKPVQITLQAPRVDASAL